jgi:hypothetical protein
MKDAIPLLEAAREVEQVLSELHLKAVLIGGLAILRWGEARATRDADFTMLCAVGNERAQAAAVLGRLRARIDDAQEFAEMNKVLLVQASNGRPVDIALGSFEYEARMVDRGSTFEFAPGVKLRTCSAEDLVVLKAFAGRDGDWQDVKGILVRQARHLDFSLIEKELKPLLALKDDSETWVRLEVMKARLTKAK